MLIPSDKFNIFYILFLIIGTYERITNTFSKKQSKPTKKIYYKWIYFALFTTYLLCVVASVLEYFVNVKTVNVTVSISGFIIYGFGIFLRRSAIDELGEHWSNFTEIKEKHQIINTGVYGVFSNPYYLAVMLELIGICLIANTYYALCIVLVVHMPLLILRIVLEKKVLKSNFGKLNNILFF